MDSTAVQPEKRGKGRGLWAVVALALVLLVGGMTILYKRISDPGIHFDAARWQDEATSANDGTRLLMADRIVARQSLAGKTRAEVVAVLGEPRDHGYFREFDLVYRLGNERGFMSIDSEWLAIRLGADGKVVESIIVRD